MGNRYSLFDADGFWFATRNDYLKAKSHQDLAFGPATPYRLFASLPFVLTFNFRDFKYFVHFACLTAPAAAWFFRRP